MMYSYERCQSAALSWAARRIDAMPSDDNWLKAHKFLVDHFLSQAPFTQADLFAVTTWKGQSPKTYWSKQIKQFLGAASISLVRSSK